MSTVYNDPIMLDSTGQDIVTKLDSIASLMGDGVIDDTSTTATDKTWSASKENTVVNGLQSNVIANTKLIKDTVGWSGKNKFRYPYRNTTKTDHGITFTDNGNGSITVSGTNDGTESKFFFETENQPNAREYLTSLGEVILTGGNANARLIMSGIDDSGYSVIDTGEGVTFTFANVSHAFQLKLSVPPNAVFSNPVTIYPMLRDANILDSTYEPYFGSTAFPRSEQAVLGAKQWFDASRYASNTSATPTITNKGKTINVANSTAASYAFAIWTMDVVPNTDYKISSNLTITSGKGGIKIETTAGTQIAISSAYTTSGEIEFSFNSGNNTAVRISLFSTFGTSETGDITFDDFLISLASDTDRSFAPYAMTNRELTDAVTLKDVTSDIIRNTEQTAYSISNLFVYKIGRLVTVIGDISSVTENAVPSGRTFTTIATGLPKALRNSNIFAMPIGNGNQTQVYVEGNSSDMKMRGGTTGQTYQFVFTYISAS